VVLLGIALFGVACSQQPATPPPIVQVEEAAPVPGEIELSHAKAKLAEAALVRFEVNYRFTKGKPDKFYLCQISFPGGTANNAIKPMNSWELKVEGVIKDGVTLRAQPVKSFEISISEGPSSRGPFKKISNLISGPVEE
jgi:hypothetical protein